MADTKNIIPKLERTLGDTWNQVAVHFDSKHSAANWLTGSFATFGNSTPLSFLQGSKQQQNAVWATLNQFDDIRIG